MAGALTLNEIKDEPTRKALTRLQALLTTLIPITQYEYVDVTFPSSANVDTVVKTRLDPDNPENVVWEVVGVNCFTVPAAAPCIYRDTSATRKPWSRGFIVLRSNVASVVATLRLSVPKDI